MLYKKRKSVRNDAVDTYHAQYAVHIIFIATLVVYAFDFKKYMDLTTYKIAQKHTKNDHNG